MKSRVRLLTLTALVAFATGCSGVTDLETIFGRYELNKIGAQGLPRDVVNKFGETLSVTAGYIDLAADETCIAGFTTRSIDGGPTATEIDTCVFRLVGTAIFVTWSDGDSSPGFVFTGELSLTINNRGYRFKK